MSSKNNSKKLLDAARQAPTELSKKEVAKMIGQLPNLPVSPRENDWTRYINLNSIIMSIIGISLIISSLFFFSGNETAPNTEISAITPPLPTVEQKVVEEEKEDDLIVINYTQKTSATSSTDVQTQFPNSREVVVEIPDVVYINTASQKPEKEIKQKSISTNNSSKEYHAGGSSGIQMDVPTQKDGKIKLAKLKRELYKFLIADKLIKSKKEEVELVFTSNHISVNGEALSSDLQFKYSNYLQSMNVVPSEYKKIVLRSNLVAVGDFTPDGFKGEGLGTFTTKDLQEFSSDEDAKGLFFGQVDFGEEEQQMDGIFEKEMEEAIDSMSLFWEQEKSILREKANDIDGLFSNKDDSQKPRNVHISHKKMDSFNAKLRKHLNQDNLIPQDDEFFLIIDSRKDGIFINGEEIRKNARAYQALFKDYKVGYGPNRQVRVSRNITQAGDFYSSSFRGTECVPCN